MTQTLHADAYLQVKKRGFISDIQAAWRQPTSNDPNGWSRIRPAHGQCVVSALKVQSRLQGEILRVMATTPSGKTVSHYVNLLPNGELLDVTASQFPDHTIFDPPMKDTLGTPNIDELRAATQEHLDKRGFASMREYLLSSPDTKARYETFEKEVQLAEQRRLQSRNR
ncbi:MAG: hypothetical protein K2Q12_07805 [Rickettsiales bacterium]|nr:hypothetical protein [Rickettsiales bacterium]